MPRTKAGVSKIPSLVIENPGRGLNNAEVDTLIDNRESPDSLNIQVTGSGTPGKRNGYTQVGSTIGTGSGIQGLGSLVTSAGVHKAICVWNGALYELVGTTWTIVNGKTWTLATKVNMVQARDAVYFHNGVDSMGKYDGTTLSSPSGGVIASFGIYYHQQHFAGGNPTNPSTLYISSTSDADTLTGGSSNQQAISNNDGMVLTGLSKFQEVLIAFKDRATYQFSFDSTGTPIIKQISSSIGAVGHRSIDTVENDVFFLSRNGVYTLGNEKNYFDVIRTNELTARIHPTFEQISDSNLTEASALYSGYRYYLAIPLGGTTVNNRVLVYDRRFSAWELWDNLAANCITEYIDSSSVKHVYFGDESTGKIWEISTSSFSDDSGAISARYLTKNHDMDLSDTFKQFLDVTLFFKQVVGTLTITVIIDGATIAKNVTISNTSSSSTGFGTGQFGSMELGEGSGSASTTLVSSNVPYRIPLNKRGRTIQVKIENANANETFTLLKYSISFRPFGHYSFPSSLKLQ